MPKLKTHRGAAKRFKRTASGGIKYRCAYRNHILTKKTTKQKRKLRVSTGLLNKSNARMADRMLQGG